MVKQYNVLRSSWWRESKCEFLKRVVSEDDFLLYLMGYTSRPPNSRGFGAELTAAVSLGAET